MTQFRVLPVRCGAAYLLKSKRGSYLVDGGRREGSLCAMLTDRRVGKLRAAVCSSTTPERIGGILELLENGYNVKEYWFPNTVGVLAAMARRFNGDWKQWIKLTHPGTPNPEICTQRHSSGIPPKDFLSRNMKSAITLIGLAAATCLGRSPVIAPHDDSSQDQIFPSTPGLPYFFDRIFSLLTDQISTHWSKENAPTNRLLNRMGQKLFSSNGPEDLIVVCGQLILAETDRPECTLPKETKRMVRELIVAATISAMLTKNSATLRFFRQTDTLCNTLIPRHPFKCLNGIEALPAEFLPKECLPKDIFHYSQNEIRKKEGLTFRYGDGQCGVLFCGDTRLSFLGKQGKIQTDRPMVIAAPRQGYCSADRSYKRIISYNPNRDVWVRSHYSYARKVANSYREKPLKYCLNNCVSLTVREILLRFDTDRWNTESGGSCSCS